MTPTFFDSGQLGVVDADAGHGGVGRAGSAVAPRVRAESRRAPRYKVASGWSRSARPYGAGEGTESAGRGGAAAHPPAEVGGGGSGFLPPSPSPAEPIGTASVFIYSQFRFFFFLPPPRQGGAGDPLLPSRRRFKPSGQL